MTSPIKKLTSRDTKANILAAYQQLAGAYRALEKRAASSKVEPSSPPASTAMVVAKDALPAPLAGGLVGQLSGMGSRIGEHTSSLQQRLTAEAVRLLELRERVESRTAELSRLYQIEVESTSLSTLLSDYESFHGAAEEEQRARAEASAKEQAELRESWGREKKVRAAARKEALSERDKGRARESETYAYEQAQRRKKEQDERAEAEKAFEAELEELRATAEAAREARERSLVERERELRELTARAESFEEELRAAREKGERVGTAIAKRDAQTKAELTKKETEGKAKVYELRIASLEESLNKQGVQIGSLTRQLDTALTQAQDLAVKAIEGSSNATSFEALREIALEQAKGSGKSK